MISKQTKQVSESGSNWRTFHFFKILCSLCNRNKKEREHSLRYEDVKVDR